MAESHCTTPAAQQTDTLSKLRDLAMYHLQEIDKDKIQEEKDELKKAQDLERYAKQKRREKQSTDTSSSATPMPKMRSAVDVLSRLQWDLDLKLSQYVVGYLERFEGIKEMPAQNWISESTNEEWIPQHRIKYFKRVGDDGDAEIVWDRERRVDQIFGSGLQLSSVSDGVVETVN